MGSYRLGLVHEPDFSLASAITASAAFPPFLSPFRLRLDPHSFENTEGADLYGREDLRAVVDLSDGGVYDNLGVETLWRRYETVLVSDGGASLNVDNVTYGWWPRQVRRVIDTATSQAGALRRRSLVADFQAGLLGGGLWRITTDLADYPVSSRVEVHESWRRVLAALPTRLAPLKGDMGSYLVNWGYLLADITMRSYVEDNAVTISLPFPDVEMGVQAFDR